MEMFFFAWINESEVFDPAVHNRLDEDVFAHTFSHKEGDFATLECEVQNPRIGLLNVGRKRWCYYSFSPNYPAVPPAPFFKGRLLGIPDNIFDDAVTFQFIAKSSDWVARKMALAETLKVRPYWDDLFISPDAWNDPDTVLEGRSALWHIHPVTHAWSISDVLLPEDGVVEYTAGQFFRDGMSLQLQQVPLRSVTVDIVFPWTNEGTGAVDLMPVIRNAFPDTLGDLALIWSYTFEGLASSWPQAGTKIGDAWNVTSGELRNMNFLTVRPLPIPFYFDPAQIKSLPVTGALMFAPKISGRYWGGIDGAGFDTSSEIVIVNPGWGMGILTASFAASRSYSQTLHFTLEADIQAIITEATEDEATVISLTANPATDLGYAGTPACSLFARTFLDSPRGIEATEHALMMGRAVLCVRARAVHIGFETPFKLGLPISLRKGSLIHDPRLPGGQAAGKVIEYSHTLDGASNAATSTIVIGSSIGYGGSHSVSAGDGVYAAAGYMAAGYQQMENVVALTATSDITFEMPTTATFDDGVDVSTITANSAVLSCFFTDGPNAQLAALPPTSEIGDQQKVDAVLQLHPTKITLQLVNLNTGPFVGGVQPALSKLIIPQQINLEAAST